MYYPIDIEITNFLSIQYAKYEFRKGKPTLIVGQNNTDDGQKSNGVGKSSLVDAISFAIAGDPATRKVKQSELVRFGQKSANVKVRLLNHNGKALVIDRTIFSGTGSQACSFSIDSSTAESEKLVGQDAKDNWILKEIGISKEDFFTFFMITKEKYNSFLAATDTKKKIIINRFSGAEKIELIKPYVEAEIELWDEEIQIVDIAINTLNGKLEVYKEQLDKEREVQDIPAKVAKLEEQILEIRKEIEVLEEKNRFVRDENDRVNLEITSYNTSSLESEATLLDKNKESLITQENALSTKITTLTKKISAIEQAKATERANISTSQRSLNQEMIELQNLKAQVESQLKGFIECPKCENKFSLSTEVDFTVEEGEEGIKEFEETIIAFELELIQFDNKLKEVDLSRIRDTQKVRQEIKTVEEERNVVTNQMSAIDHKILAKRREIADINAKISFCESELKINRNILDQQLRAYNNYDLEISTLLMEIDNAESGGSAQTAIEGFETMIKDLEAQKAEKFDLRLEYSAKKSKAEEWPVNFRRFKSFLANQSIQDIQDYSNNYLQRFRSNITIEIGGYKEVNKKIKEEIDITVLRNGMKEGSYGIFSGGEKGRIDVAVILAIQTLINLNSTEGLELIVIDEVLESLDSTGIESIMHSLALVDKTVLIVTQNEVNVPHESTVLCTKTNKITSIIPQ